MSSIMIASRGRVERHCLKCVANKLRREGVDVEQRYCFTTPHGEYVWDVEKALRLVEATAGERAASGDFVTFTVAQMDDWLGTLQPEAVDIDHARHVNYQEPGIVAQAWDCKTGAPAAVLIDGTHRMFHAFITGVPFNAYILTHDESMSCLIRRPNLSPEILSRMAGMEAFPCAPVGG